MIRTVQAKGLSVLALATLVLMALPHFASAHLSGIVVWIVAWTGVQSMVAFYALLWALHRSDLAFYFIFVGDALLRLAALGTVTWALYAAGLSFAAPLISMAIGYLILSLVQIPFLMRAS